MAGNRFANSSARRTAFAAKLALAVLATAGAVSAAEDPADPWIDRIEPLGGQRGTSTEVTLVGKNLGMPAVLEFDTAGLAWESLGADDDGNLRGVVRIAAETPPGPHTATLSTPLGRSNSRLFYVDELPSVVEAEPNDTVQQAQRIDLKPQTLHGAMHALPDIDFFSFEAGAGERWTFDLRSLEYGGFLENDLTLLNAEGQRVAFNDDRDDYLETPFLEHVFTTAGRYYLKLDQYRGPQRVNCNRNCGYMLRIGQLPVVEAAHPLGARVGAQVEISLRGRALETVERVWIAPVRRAEYYRLTFPYTVPVRTDQMAGTTLDGKIVERETDRISASFEIPSDAWQGLWRVWVRSPGGITDGISLEISDMPEPDCREVVPTSAGTACDAVLQGDDSEHEYWLELGAGQPVVMTTLAAQLGLPYIDTVLELFDSQGELVAEHDDLMSGQGTVIGNPDSMLYFKAADAGRFRLVVRDRIGRGGPDMAYRLRIEEREPGFALLSDPENLNVRPGETERVGVLMTPEPGFDHAVDVWIEDPPRGISAGTGRFRADQFFGPSGDGDNIVIPTTFLDVQVDPELPPGDYPLRILGRATHGGPAVEAISTLWIGPPRKRNDVRRPLAGIRLTVVDGGRNESETVAEARSAAAR